MVNMDFMKMGKRIKEERVKNKITQEHLAEMAGLSSHHISHIETGTTKPSIESLINICNSLNVTPDYVLFDSIYNSKEYLKDELATLLKGASTENIQLIIRLAKAVLDK